MMPDMEKPAFRDRLLRGERLIGTLVSLPSPELAEIASEAGFDWLFIDLEHGAIGAEDALRLVQAVRPPCAPVIRVPENSEMWIKKALDTGAAGLIFPRINSAEEAARAVHWGKYPPEGGRSVGFSRAGRYGLRFQEHVESANAETVLIAQIEHVEAVAAIEGILGVTGIDAVFVGPYDLSASMGKPGRIQDEDVRRAVRTVREACAARKLPAGIFAQEVPGARQALDEGYTLVCAGLDIVIYARAATESIRALKSRNS